MAQSRTIVQKVKAPNLRRGLRVSSLVTLSLFFVHGIDHATRGTTDPIARGLSSIFVALVIVGTVLVFLGKTYSRYPLVIGALLAITFGAGYHTFLNWIPSEHILSIIAFYGGVVGLFWAAIIISYVLSSIAILYFAFRPVK
jgi:hypothetical protein